MDQKAAQGVGRLWAQMRWSLGPERDMGAERSDEPMRKVRKPHIVCTWERAMPGVLLLLFVFSS